MNNKKRSKRKLDHLEQVCLEIKNYNKKHKTNYSYGEYKALLRLRKTRSKRV